MEPLRVDTLPTAYNLSLYTQRTWQVGRDFITSEYVWVDDHPWVCTQAHEAVGSLRPGSSGAGLYWARALRPGTMYVVGSSLYISDSGTPPAATVLGGGGPTLLSQTEVTSDVDYLDLELDSAYSLFRILLYDFQIGVGDIVAFALSADGGATFLNNNVDYDSYELQIARLYTPNSTDTQVGGFKGNDALGVFTRTSDDGANDTGPPYSTEYGRTVDALLFAGATGRRASMMSTAGGTTGASSNGVFTDFGRVYASVTGRYNLIRIQPYGNGDCNPPTSGFKITGGRVLLYGVD